MKRTDIAYVAGIIDGEGSIGIYKKFGKDKRRYYQLTVQVSNSNEWLIRWLQMAFGSYAYHHGHYSCEKIKRNREIYTWSIVGNKAVDFLKTIHPYLRLKKPQAEIAIRFQENRNHKTSRLTGGEKAVMEAERILISNLNQGK